MNITACLITYKRPNNIGPIVSHLLQQPFIDTVVVRDNAKNNSNVYGRYELARQAPSDIVYVQDDDCIVHDIEQIYQTFVNDPERIAFGLAPTHHPVWHLYTFPETQLAMVGWGAFFKRDWIDLAFNRYFQHHELDAFSRREADRIFSLMLARQHNSILSSNLEHLPGCSDGDAMSKEADHFNSRARAIEQCLAILRNQ